MLRAHEKYREVKKEWERIGVRLSLTAPILRALSLALKANPVCRNPHRGRRKPACHTEDRYRSRGGYPGGLFVPVLRDIDKKSLRQVAVELTGSVRKGQIGNAYSR